MGSLSAVKLVDINDRERENVQR